MSEIELRALERQTDDYLRAAAGTVALAQYTSEMFKAKRLFGEAGLLAAKQSRLKGVEINGWDGSNENQPIMYIDLPLKRGVVLEKWGAVTDLASNSYIQDAQARDTV